jgi:uncharacterized protein YjbI with pentapeptide repeats
LYGIEFGFRPSPIFQVSAETGRATKILDTNVFGGGLAFDPLRSVFFATDSNVLRAINPTTGGAATQIFSNARHVAYDAFRDQLYVNEENAGLRRVDRRTADGAWLGELAGEFIKALAFQPQEDRLYAVLRRTEGGPEQLVRFNDLANLSNRAIVATFAGDDPNITALAWDDSSQSFFASATNNPFRSLLRIDPDSGQITTVGSFAIGNESIEGLAWVPLDRQAWFYSLNRYATGDLRGAALRFCDLSGWDFAGKQLDGADFTASNLRQTNFTDASVVGASFKNTTSAHAFTAEQLYATASYREQNLQGVRLDGNDLSQWNFAGQNLSHASFASSRLNESNLSGAILHGADFSGAHLSGAKLDGADIRGAKFTNAKGLLAAQFYATANYQQRDLSGVDFGATDLSGGNFAEQNLQQANLSRTTLADADLTRTNLSKANVQGATLVRARLTQANLVGADLSLATLADANLAGANLSGANFSSAALMNADLTGAVVNRTYFNNTTARGFTKEQLYSTANYQAKDLSGIGLSANNLTGVDFRGHNLMGADLSRSNLTDANFRGANLHRAWLASATLTGADLNGARLSEASFDSAALSNADLSGADITRANLSRTTRLGFTKQQFYLTANYQAKDLREIQLEGNDLTGWDFNGQVLTNAHLAGARFTNADLSGAIITGAGFSRVIGLTKEQLYSTASYQARDLRGVVLAGNNLTGWDFRAQNLAGANLAEATLASSDFTGATLTNASLYGAKFTNAVLQQATLTGATLSNANMTGANLTGATMANAKLSSATLTNANLTDTNITGTDFSETTSRGFTKEQLYATANYQAKNLQGIGLGNNQLSGWDFRGQDLRDAKFAGATLIDADLTDSVVTGADFSSTSFHGFTKEQLYATASYQAKDLTRIMLAYNDLTGWNFAGQNISGVDFGGTTYNGGFTKEQLYSTASYQAKDLSGVRLTLNNLRDWDFTGQKIAGADFGNTTREGGFTQDQLYSTASYQAKDLPGVGLAGNDLSGWNLAGQKLQRADFSSSTIAGANLTRADLRGATHLQCTTYGCADTWASALPSATVSNAILADGTVPGLALTPDERLTVRDDDGGPNALLRYQYPEFLPSEWPPISVAIQDRMEMADGSVLTLLFDADPWDSRISFESGIPVQLGGTLELAFADDQNLATQVGRTLRLFDWTGVAPSGQFVIRSPYAWDLRNLYETGEVTLIAVPEPSGTSNTLTGLFVLTAGCRLIHFRCGSGKTSK